MPPDALVTKVRRRLRKHRRFRSAYYFFVAVGRAVADSRASARAEFEQCYGRVDPWSYSSNREAAERYSLALSLLDAWGEGRRPRALEIGCGEGLFTARLAPRCSSLVAVDISAAALERARDRCRTRSNIEFAQWDLRSGTPLGRFDLVVCMDVVCSIRRPLARRRALRTVTNCVDAGGGLLVSAYIQDDFVEDAIWARWLGLGASTNISQFAEQRRIRAPGRRASTAEHLLALFETVA